MYAMQRQTVNNLYGEIYNTEYDQSVKNGKYM